MAFSDSFKCFNSSLSSRNDLYSALACWHGLDFSIKFTQCLATLMLFRKIFVDVDAPLAVSFPRNKLLLAISP